ncbi:MAG: ComEC/Rec2 family competence protein [Deltaproteobacteria bacterium]|nr:ComEC/Rec2 family competence protein [Deltaproteobacteria bacterium]
MRGKSLALLAMLLGGLVACEELMAEVAHWVPEEAPPPARRPRRRTPPRVEPVQPMVPPSVGFAPQNTPIVPGALRMRVTFVDVGQGDSALLESADGHAGLIDAGPPGGDEHLRALLAQRGVTRLDWMILTHPHLDHIGGARNVMRAVTVGRVLDPAFAHPIATYDRLLAEIQLRAIPFAPARQGQTLTLGNSIRLEILLPRMPFIERSRSEANANSVVVRASAGNVRVLFTGDAESETETRLLAEQRGMLSAQVLKVAHHGSRYASSPEFLQAVGAQSAVISCAQGNDYGHPHAETVANLGQARMRVYRTDLNGDITMSTDGSQVAFATSR